jgi:hypothetical protein
MSSKEIPDSQSLHASSREPSRRSGALFGGATDDPAPAIPDFYHFASPSVSFAIPNTEERQGRNVSQEPDSGVLPRVSSLQGNLQAMRSEQLFKTKAAALSIVRSMCLLVIVDSLQAEQPRELRILRLATVKALYVVIIIRGCH